MAALGALVHFVRGAYETNLGKSKLDELGDLELIGDAMRGEDNV